MKKTVFLVAAVFLTLGFVFTVLAQDLVWENIGRENSDLRTVLVDFNEPRIIYIGSSRGVFKSEAGGENWRNILSVKGQNRSVNYLLFDFSDKNSLYAATGNGLFFSADQGKSWNRIFKGKNYLETECTTLAVLPYAIYLGTKGGLSISQDKGRSWHKATAKLGSSYILAIAYDIKEPNYIYVACIDGVFKTQDNGQSWERVFLANPTEDGNDIKEEIEDQDEEERLSNIRYISLDPNKLNYLYLTTSRGLYKSRDRGKTWESVSSYGLFSQDIEILCISDKSYLYAVTKSGIFEYKGERWQELSFGLVAGNIRFLASDSQNNLYAACDKGLFKANLNYFNNGNQDNIISLYFENEPKINEIQQAAIRYAEVGAEKIKEWGRLAAKKALLPQVSVGIDRNTTDLCHWEGGSTTKTDDDILRRGRDSIDCDVTLIWNLGELIWNDDQTSIDVRSRLMVELRPLNVPILSLQ